MSGEAKKMGRIRRLTDKQRKVNKADEQRKRRASKEGKKWTKEYYQRPEVKAIKKERGKLFKNREAIRNWGYKKDFGITIEDYDKMFKKQKGLCAICGLPENKIRLSVDHCHDTGEVRGLLCGSCNRGLGLFRDNCELLKKAINYLYGK